MNLNRATQYFTKSILIIMLSACGGREIEEPAKIDNPEKAEEPIKTEEPAQEYITLGNGEKLINEFGGFYQKIPHLSDINGNAVALVLGADGRVKDKPVVVLSTGETERPQFFLNQSNQLVNPNSLQAFTTIGNSSPLTLLKDEEGQVLIGESGGFAITQVNHLGQPEANEVFFNTTTGELWKDSNGNLSTKKRIDSDVYVDSWPKNEETAALNLGFRQTVAPDLDVLFAASPGFYHPSWETEAALQSTKHYYTITAVTKDGGLLVFGGHENQYLGSQPAQSYDPSTNSLVPSTTGQGILKITDTCQFDEDLLLSRFHTPPLLNEILDNNDLGCYPKNIRQFASSLRRDVIGVLTKTNELWGIGHYGGKLGDNNSVGGTEPREYRVVLPVKIAIDLKMTTLHQSGGYQNISAHALTNDGEVFRIHGKHHALDNQGNPISATSEEAVIEGFFKLKVPNDDYIINLFPSNSPKVLALGASGNYYLLGRAPHLPLLGDEPKLLEFNPPVKDIVSVGVVEENWLPSVVYLGVDGNLYSYHHVGSYTSGYSDGVSSAYKNYIDSHGYREENLSLKSTKDIVFSEVIGGGQNILIKDNEDNYYTKANYAYDGVFLGASIDHGFHVRETVLVKLGSDIPAIKFLENNPNYEFLYNDFRVLVNKTDKKIAIIDTAAYAQELSGVAFFTEPPQTGERTVYGSVHIMPDEISEQLFLAD
ncbi:hypothetical protein AB9R81_23565 [Vibrio cyclitrophicus]